MRGPKRAIGEVELDLGRYELRCFGRRVKLEKKPMELLVFLVGRREQMVSREEIVKKLWRSDLFIDTDRNLNNIVRKIRTALGDDSAKPRFVETVVGKGYRFIGPVRVIGAQYPRYGLGQASARVVRQEDASERGERSSLAVLPLLILGKATDDHGLCLGFADALVSRLGNLQGVDVLTTAAVLNLPLGATASDIASHLGIRFVVHGASQVSKGQWRLSLEMFDANLQSVCFTRKCDLDVNRVSDLESEIAKQIAGALNRPLGAAMVQQRSALPVLKDAGIRFEKLSAPDCAKRWPQINFDGVSWSVYEPDSGFLAARRGCEAVLNAFLTEGCRYRQAQASPGSIVSHRMHRHSCWRSALHRRATADLD
jgi:DNA-binding winged helix-turn-helix (wHTH) protein